MKTTTISELKAHLSNYLGKVKSGTEVLVTDRGKPVARIIPISGKKRTRQSLSGMERQGLIKLGTGNVPQDFWTTPQGEDSKDLVLKALLEERKEGSRSDLGRRKPAGPRFHLFRPKPAGRGF